jgi:8-oxo-dGTP pyrophosphatase MutT (NUDIX family)
MKRSKENRLFEKIETLLKTRSVNRIEMTGNGYRHASVLIPLFEKEGEPHVLFTKRTWTVDAHKGQISFPGGGVEKSDGTYGQTALRESQEEVGLRQEDVRLLGATDDQVTMASLFLIHPFVGAFDFPYPFSLNGDEVDRLIQIPLDAFIKEDILKRDYPVAYQGKTYTTDVYHYGEDLIWGATARIMMNFVEIIKEDIDLPL